MRNVRATSPVFMLATLCGLMGLADGLRAGVELIAPAGYLPGVPVLVRVELRGTDGTIVRHSWDAEAVLSADSTAVTLSTDRVPLHNGIGTALVELSGTSDFTLRATVGGDSDTQSMVNQTALPVQTVSGLLPGTSTTWSGVVRVTEDVTVPAGHTLTISAGTLVLFDGVASGSAGASLIVRGSVQSLGTKDHPVTLTCLDAGLNWGQLRHENAQPSRYQYTFISKAGRAPGEGHTGTGPAVRSRDSEIVFEDCVISDLTSNGATIGKIMQATGSDLTFRGCVLTRARMGPEITGTGLDCTDTWITEMTGPDDADGIYLHESGGRPLTLSDCVIGFGDDDGIDTLNSDVVVENCIIRDWANPNEDAKGVSVFHGEVRLERCLVVDCYVGVSAKSSGPMARVFVDHCTITGITRGLSAAWKSNAEAGNIQIQASNSIVRSVDAIHTDFSADDFAISYCNLSEVWPGLGNIAGDPLFVDEAGSDYRLQAASPAIDAGDPLSPPDPDGTRADLGVFSFEQSDLPGNQSPAVALTSPPDNTTFAWPAAVMLEAGAIDFDGRIVRVEFFQEGVKLGEDDTPPYSYEWRAAPLGRYTLLASATDDDGATNLSNAIRIEVAAPAESSTNVFIAVGSNWKYLDDGSDQGTAWRSGSFDDAAWAEGPAELGYGDGDEATIVSFGPDAGNKFVTTYFRREFMVEDADLVESLTLSLLRDDGGIVYLNEVEVFRLGMPEGAVDYRTYASRASEYDFGTVDLAPEVLRSGANVIAVEIHQGNAGSSDISFDLELTGLVAAPSNRKPLVVITSPANGATLAAATSIVVAAQASDADGVVATVAYYANGQFLGESAGAPYELDWTDLAPGAYRLIAVATDDLGLAGVSESVDLTVRSDTQAPTIEGVSPPPGALNRLTQLTVTFSKEVLGVDAGDLLINGTPARSVVGSGSVYSFGFDQPTFGEVEVAWVEDPGITDIFTPPHPFDPAGPDTGWQYTLVDIEPPLLTLIDPVPGSTVAKLSSVTVTFDEPVTGVRAADLLVNDVPAASLTDQRAERFTFVFTEPTPGPVRFAWAASQNIRDRAGNRFDGGDWLCGLDGEVTGVVISEIMYHPASEDAREEYIELLNQGAATVDLTGWRFTSGVAFVFPEVTLPPGGYLAVAADLEVFANKYPEAAPVVGGWSGNLSNTRERIDLEDAAGNLISSVTYADEGDWARRQLDVPDRGVRGWIWTTAHDGAGRSAELINPALPNDNGQNWAASLELEGTPGRTNSVLADNTAPLILEARHYPIVPRSSDIVIVTARVIDEAAGGTSVSLFHRADPSPASSFTVVPMTDDGAGADAVGGDGVYTAALPPHANDTVVEFYLEARDSEDRIRTWPAATIETDGSVIGQTANMLYQVDDNGLNEFTGDQPLYKVVMTEAQRATLAAIPGISSNQGPNSQMNATFISLDATGTELHYQVGIRNRGHGTRTANPPNYRINFRSDDKWKGVEALNLNSRQVHAQHFGSVISRLSGAAGPSSIPVQVRVNNRNLAVNGPPMFDAYAAVEVIGSDWTRRHVPEDGDGNLYRAVRDIRPPEFDYRTLDAYPQLAGAESKHSYTNTWSKQSNVSVDDWSDLIGLLRVMGPNGTTPFNEQNVRSVINAEQWLRHLAVMNLLGNAETGLNSGYNDDYYLYRGESDTRFILLYWDLDQILGINRSFAPDASIFTPGADNGAGRALDRFLHLPAFEPIYLRILRELIDGPFSESRFDATLEDTLSSYVPGATLDAMKGWMDQRREYVRATLEVLAPSQIETPTTILSGVPRSPTPLTGATITVGGPGITHYRWAWNGGVFSAETPVSLPIEVSGLADGIHAVAVIGRDKDGGWQDVSAPTTGAWEVDVDWPAVRLNEILARNDGAVHHLGLTPDLVELYNEGQSEVDLAGLGLSDDPARPHRFTFPAGARLAAGEYLILMAGDPDGTPGLRLGFALSERGETLGLYERAREGGKLLDSVTFGLQIANLSVGRSGTGGEWFLTQPSLGEANRPQTLGPRDNLRINEWLAFGRASYPDDFIELFNPDPLPVAMGGLFLSDEPNGAPGRHRIAPLSFIAGDGFNVFLADGDTTAGADHVGFRLSAEQGEIALFDDKYQRIDSVVYGPQNADTTEGRCPDGALSHRRLLAPTAGAPNQCPVAPPVPERSPLIAIDSLWRFEATGADPGIAWRDPEFDDTDWPEGPALLAVENCGCLPAPILTPLVFGNPRQNAFYFRAHFDHAPDGALSALELTHVIDDGAVFYLNGTEIGRFNMPAGEIVADTRASSTVGDASFAGPFPVPLEVLRPGDNVLAVEVHQASANSSDVVFGLRLEALAIEVAPPGVILNELSANAGAATEGTSADWVEIHNPSATSIDLAGMSLSDTVIQPARWVFPTGSIVPAQGYYVVDCDGDSPASDTNTGFGLKATGGAVYLFDRPDEGGGLASSVDFGFQPAGWTLGRDPDGGSDWLLAIPTPGEANQAATLGDPWALVINEWMANPTAGPDWFEIHNPEPRPVDLGELRLTDRIDEPDKHVIAPRSFIGVGSYGYQRFVADGDTSAGADHVAFSLSADGETIAMLDGVNAYVIDTVTFGPQGAGVAAGRFPDGEDEVHPFPATASPGRANYLPLEDIVVNEILAGGEFPFEDAVELFNQGAEALELGGWWLSDSEFELRKYRVPNDSAIPADEYRVFYEGQFNGPDAARPFLLDAARGGRVFLSQTDAEGELTGYRAVASFDPAASGVSQGRFPTSQGTHFVALAWPTFGSDDPESVEEFRTGAGERNATAKVGPVVIGEIMYHPPLSDPDLEYLELLNASTSEVPLYDPDRSTNTWRLRGGINLDFPSGLTLAPGARLVAVPFDPLGDTSRLAAFTAAYGFEAALVGPYAGRMANGGETIVLLRPDAPVTQPGPDLGLIPYLLVDRVSYDDRTPWPTRPDGLGDSLHRVDARVYGNDPANWTAGAPTPGDEIQDLEDTDGDGMPDAWERLNGLDVAVNDANGDADQDGMNNLDEYRAGTRADDPNDLLVIHRLELVGGRLEFRFHAAPGKAYALEHRESLAEGAWMELVGIEAESVAREVVVGDPGAGEIGQRYYRLRLRTE